MGIVRTTFIIDENGKIEDVISKVNIRKNIILKFCKN